MPILHGGMAPRSTISPGSSLTAEPGGQGGRGNPAHPGPPTRLARAEELLQAVLDESAPGTWVDIRRFLEEGR